MDLGNQPQTQQGPQVDAPQPATPMPGQQPMDASKMTLLKEPAWEQVEALLKNPVLREFRIDVETDSTIRMDEDNERQARMQFIQAVSQLIGEASAVPQSMIPAAGELILFGIRGFKVARSLERVFEEAIDKLTNAPPKPDPEMMKMQAQLEGQKQIASIKADTDLKIAQNKAQMDAQVADAAQQSQAREDQIRTQAESQRNLQEQAMKSEHEQALTDLKQRFEAERTQFETASKEKIAEADNATKLQIAGLQREHERQLEGMKHEHEQKLTAATQSHEQKMAEHQAKTSKDLEETKGKVAEKVEGVKGENAKAVVREKPKAETSEKGKQEDKDSEPLKAVLEHLKKPRKVIRDKDGKITGIE